ncbi:GNAT family N-acetyltransferase [Zobellella maritima]|uniref:GNAT family N-acetyltransferase n=1 Tax=Zobellella maritima TaxID=2059725 RepID=UPI000E2FFECE|nr:GNAT family N-acetyltransferase [Zobellella maritima]
MTQNNTYTIRTMTRPEIDIAIDWAAAEGWNPGLHDADCFYAADTHGFLVGLLGAKPIAVISVVKYGGSFGFLGLYIVKPEFRGLGYGLQIWNAGLAYLGGRDIGLDGVIAQQANYNRSGFTLAYSNVRYQGHGGGEYPAHSGIVPLASMSFADICTYDTLCFPESRPQFLWCWLNQAGSSALGIRQDGKLAGYGVVRKCRSGYKIGPLFADTAELAEPLFLALQSRVPEGEPLFLDTPAANGAAIALARRHHMRVSFEAARMYRGQSPAVSIKRLFGVTSFELG